MAFDAAVQDYKERMETVCGSSEPYVKSNTLLRNHTEYCANALSLFNSYTKFGDSQITVVHEQKLKEVLRSYVERADIVTILCISFIRLNAFLTQLVC